MKTLITSFKKFLQSFKNAYLVAYYKAKFARDVRPLYADYYFGDIPVVVNDKMARYLAADFISETIPIALAVTNMRIIVVSNNVFKLLSEDSLIAMFCHEAGHLYYKHYKDVKGGDPLGMMTTRLKVIESGSVPKEEIEADLYAASIVGKQNVINMLQEIKKNMDEIDPYSLVSKELFIRIRLLLESEVEITRSLSELVRAY